MPEIEVVEDIMSVNDRLAAQIQGQMDAAGVLSLNMMASPGGGKTSVTRRTVEALKDDLRIGYMDGDIVEIDADHIKQLGVPTTLINTGGDCHLDANKVNLALPRMDLSSMDLLVIENVGNLVCPAAWKIGAHLNVVIASVPEGSDKPYKYPAMFRGAHVLILNKIDLLPYIDFDLDYFRHGVEVLNPGVEFFPVSAKTGEGFDAWLDWLCAQIEAKKATVNS